MKTNEQAKQEAIKKAWGQHYSTAITYVYPYDDEQGKAYKEEFKRTGRLTINFVPEPLRQTLYFDMFQNINGVVWPKELNNIDNNNGWIRIEPDGSNLPADGLYKIYHIGDDEMYGGEYSKSEVRNYHKNGYITHYKPIEPELKPIY